ncbi:transmembrane protein 267-like [Tubulanus polymorphus]|uniref:transmembrane protein 267-like n=1 Tax=Tubulanus polymorphus TaxID=672921 RepID=UPI003DA496A9
MGVIFTEILKRTLTPGTFVFVGFTLIVALLGDRLLLSHCDAYEAALIDEVTHGLISAFAWMAVVANNLNFELNGRSIVVEAMLALLFGVIPDLDHVLTTGTFDLRKMRRFHRKGRPFHSSTSIPVVALALGLLRPFFRFRDKCRLFDSSKSIPVVALVLSSRTAMNLPWMSSLGIGLHHLRDATRRGVYLWPFGTTPPVPYNVYIVVTITIPIIMKFIRVTMEIMAHSRRSV